MRMRFEMSGGYGGLYARDPLTTEVDSDSLPEAERDAFLDLAQAAMAAGPVSHPQDVVPDLMTYRLEVLDGDEPWRVIFDDRSQDADIMALVDYLQQIALQERLSE